MRSLADSIIEERPHAVIQHLESRVDLNQLDEYGFTPLIEAAIADNFEIAKLLIDYGADVNLQDMAGGTALHWAAENNNTRLTQLLLEKKANPNAYNFSGQPVLVMPLLRQQAKIKKILLDAGANLELAQDFINTKLLGHMYELVGTANIIDTQNNFIEIDFEGFFLEFSLAIIAESVAQFKSHFAARELRRFSGFTDVIVNVINRAAEIIKYQQYRVNLEKHHAYLDRLITNEPTIIPIGYEGHAMTFIKVGDILVKCDRREDSRLYDNIVFYKINQPQYMTTSFIKDLIYEKQSGDFINVNLHHLLDLQPVTELKIAAQVSGNCSWANVEACIPALFFLLFSRTTSFKDNIVGYKNMAMNFFNQWREWNKNRALNFCIQSFHQADLVRKACKAEILAAILFQSCKIENTIDRERIEKILEVLALPRYEHVIQNYIKTYVYEDLGEEGKYFMRLLKMFGYQV